MQSTKKSPQIIVNKLNYQYPDGTIALKGINLNIYEGEVVGLMGKNGAGKSTLIKTFNSLLTPTSGTIIIDDQIINEVFTSELSKKVGIVFQNPELQLFANSVEDEIKFSLKNLKMTKENLEKKIEETLKTYNLENFRDRSPFNLSGGEKKRLAIASIMCRDPNIIIFDEPTIGQDASGVEFIKNLIKKNASFGKTLIMVSHDIEFVIDIVPRVILMADGNIIADGPTNKILSQDTILQMSSLISPQLIQLRKLLAEFDNNVPENVYKMGEMIRYLSSYFKNTNKLERGE